MDLIVELLSLLFNAVGESKKSRQAQVHSTQAHSASVAPRTAAPMPVQIDDDQGWRTCLTMVGVMILLVIVVAWFANLQGWI